MLLEARDLHVAYGDIRAVNGVDFHLDEGELVSIIGANGAGKTSILNGVMGLVPLRKGTLRFRGEDLTALPAYRRARAGIRMVPERARVFPRLSVYENLLTGVEGLFVAEVADVRAAARDHQGIRHQIAAPVRAFGAALRPVSHPEGTPPTTGNHPFGRRTTAAGHCPRPDIGSQASDRGRGFHGPDAQTGGSGFRPAGTPQP